MEKRRSILPRKLSSVLRSKQQEVRLPEIPRPFSVLEVTKLMCTGATTAIRSLESGASCNEVDEETGRTAAHWAAIACSRRPHTEITASCPEFVLLQRLTNAGCDLLMFDGAGLTSYHYLIGFQAPVEKEEDKDPNVGSTLWGWAASWVPERWGWTAESSEKEDGGNKSMWFVGNGDETLSTVLKVIAPHTYKMHAALLEGCGFRAPTAVAVLEDQPELALTPDLLGYSVLDIASGAPSAEDAHAAKHWLRNVIVPILAACRKQQRTESKEGRRGRGKSASLLGGGVQAALAVSEVGDPMSLLRLLGEEWPPTLPLDRSHQDLIWRQRYRLVFEGNARAALALVASCQWNVEGCAAEAVGLLEMFSPDLGTALALLGKRGSKESLKVWSRRVRSSAVYWLRKTVHWRDIEEELVDKEPLGPLLLPLVYGLRWAIMDEDRQDPLIQFLIEVAQAQEAICMQLYWMLETEAMLNKEIYGPIREELYAILTAEQRTLYSKQGQLLCMLMDRGRSLKKADPSTRDQVLGKELEANAFLVEQVFQDGLVIPLWPTEFHQGLVLSEASVFSSAMSPYRLPCVVQQGGTPREMLVKVGDDLRVDALVLEIARLCDFVFQKENVPVALQPYHVLTVPPQREGADWSHAGLVEMIGGDPVPLFCLERKELMGLVQSTPERMENYVKSLAGWTIVTYLLGVRDRHAENLLIRQLDGKLVHIDFGFVNDREPSGKFSVPVRVSTNMLAPIDRKDLDRRLRLALEALRSHSRVFLGVLDILETSGGEEWKGIVEKSKHKLAVGARGEQSFERLQEAIKRGSEFRGDANAGAHWMAVHARRMWRRAKR